jgi:hypothetical protein
MFRLSPNQALRRWLLALVGLAWLLPAGPLLAAPDHCAICGQALTNTLYTITDQVTGEKKMLCRECVELSSRCFICGLPVKEGATTLPDGRTLCARDAANAVLEEDRAVQICRETRDDLDHLFSRFLTFPETNVTIGMVDRVHLQELFRLAGRDYQCPNVLGYLQTQTNRQRMRHSLSLMSALPLAELKATAAHEYGHAWLNQNLPEPRRWTLGRDANEGFCELLSYLLMDSQNEEPEKKLILRNAYTRGQVQLFLEAQQRFGFNDILDWMKYGTDSLLSADDSDRVHRVRMPAPAAKLASGFNAGAPPPAPVPAKLMLKGVFWSQTRPAAMINDRIFEANEAGNVRVGNTNVAIRCLAIGQERVRIRVLDSGEERELRLGHPAK